MMKTKMTVKSVENGIHKHDENENTVKLVENGIHKRDENENDSEIGGKRYS